MPGVRVRPEGLVWKSRCQVWGSTTPVGAKSCGRWYAMTAWRVSLPKTARRHAQRGLHVPHRPALAAQPQLVGPPHQADEIAADVVRVQRPVAAVYLAAPQLDVAALRAYRAPRDEMLRQLGYFTRR
jgi:hypothetical protein